MTIFSKNVCSFVWKCAAWFSGVRGCIPPPPRRRAPRHPYTLYYVSVHSSFSFLKSSRLKRNFKRTPHS